MEKLRCVALLLRHKSHNLPSLHAATQTQSLEVSEKDLDSYYVGILTDLCPI